MKKILVSRKTYNKIMTAIDVAEIIVSAMISTAVFMAFTITVFLFG